MLHTRPATVLILALATASTCYARVKHFEELTASDFLTEVVPGDNIWLVQFYSRECLDCKMMSKWNKVAKELEDKVKVGRANIDEHLEFRDMFEVSTFPNLKFFMPHDRDPTDYRGCYEVEDLVQAALKLL